MLKIKEEFIAKKVVGNHKIWKADTEESLKKKLYRYMKNEVLNDKTKTILYNEITILPYDKMREERASVQGRRKFALVYLDDKGNSHKHYMTIEYNHYGRVYR